MNIDSLILGINPCIAGMNYHDPSVCLFDSDKIIFAIEEERLNRIRHSSGMFPTLAVEECKRIAERMKRPISDIAVSFDPSLCRYRNLNSTSALPNKFDERTRMALLIKRASGIYDAKVSFYPHHKAHAASSANMIMAESTMCVVFDGTGELSAASVWEVENNQIFLVDSVEMPNSLGYFYAAATAYLGFRPWGEEGKLMALAPYGRRDDSIMHQLSSFFDLDTEGSYDVSSIIGPCLHDGFALDTKKVIASFEQIFQHPHRQMESPILSWYKNFAFCIQDCVEKAVLFYIEKWRRKKNPTQICCAGGLFMNCKMNGFLRASLAPVNFFVQPVAGDAGTSIGAAILCAQEKTSKKTIIQLQELSLGLDYSECQIEEALNVTQVRYYKSNSIPQECAQMLKDGKIVAWFQGKNELGCRALGHRSILAAPTPYSMSDNINNRIKHREEWRPFACSMMEEFAEKILVGYNSSNRPAYMIEAFPINTQWYACMEAVVHRADNTTRPQVICKDKCNELYYELLKKFYELTGYPMVLNTSLNDKGQPIIQTPKEAVDFLINHDIDYLIIGNIVAHKNN
jgi:carbamoyltransferase